MKHTFLCIILVPFVLLPAARADLLGTAATFAVLAGSTVTNTGSSTVSGSVGVSPGSALIGFPPGIISGGVTHITDTFAQTAQDIVTGTYDTLSALPFTQTITGDLGGKTLIPGVYHFNSEASLTGTLTLDAGGSNNALWVFQIGSSLTTGANSVVQIINGGPGDGLFWQVGSSATLGTGTSFEGNILANQSITLQTNAMIACGRALAEIGAVTMDTNVISTACTATAGWDSAQALELGGISGLSGTGLSNPANNQVSDYAAAAVPEPAALVLLLSGFAGVIALKFTHEL